MKSIKALFLGLLVLCSAHAKADLANTNLLSNPSFDAGLTDWDLFGGTRWASWGAIYGVSGSSYYEASQVIDLVALGVNLDAIDAGYVDYSAIGGQAGYNTTDDGRMILRAYDEQGNVVRNQQTTNTTYISYTPVNLFGTLAENTRYLRLFLTGTNRDGRAIDSYFTDASFELSINDSAPSSFTSLNAVANVSAPFAAATLLMGVFAFRRRPTSK